MSRVDDQRVGAAFRSVRIRRQLRQDDVAGQAEVSRSTLSRIERGHIGSISVDALRRVGACLEIRVDVVPRWRGGELDRLLNGRHPAMHETVARLFAGTPGWVTSPEVSFSVYGERGVIDVLGWHAARRALVVVELKTELVDVQDLIASVDGKRRLAGRVAHERGWDAATVSRWVVFADGRTNRRRVAAHRTVFRTAPPDDGRRVSRWLSDPVGELGALSFLSISHPGNVRRGSVTQQRVRVPPESSRGGRAERGTRVARATANVVGAWKLA